MNGAVMQTPVDWKNSGTSGAGGLPKRAAGLRSALKLTRKKIAIEMVPVIDPLLCRKAASYFDEEGTIASLDFVVFRFRDLLLVAPSDEPWVLLSSTGGSDSGPSSRS